MADAAGNNHPCFVIWDGTSFRGYETKEEMNVDRSEGQKFARYYRTLGEPIQHLVEKINLARDLAMKNTREFACKLCASKQPEEFPESFFSLDPPDTLAPFGLHSLNFALPEETLNLLIKSIRTYGKAVAAGSMVLVDGEPVEIETWCQYKESEARQLKRDMVAQIFELLHSMGRTIEDMTMSEIIDLAKAHFPGMPESVFVDFRDAYADKLEEVGLDPQRGAEQPRVFIPIGDYRGAVAYYPENGIEFSSTGKRSDIIKFGSFAELWASPRCNLTKEQFIAAKISFMKRVRSMVFVSEVPHMLTPVQMAEVVALEMSNWLKSCFSPEEAEAQINRVLFETVLKDQVWEKHHPSVIALMKHAYDLIINQAIAEVKTEGFKHVKRKEFDDSLMFTDPAVFQAMQLAKIAHDFIQREFVEAPAGAIAAISFERQIAQEIKNKTKPQALSRVKWEYTTLVRNLFKQKIDLMEDCPQVSSPIRHIPLVGIEIANKIAEFIASGYAINIDNVLIYTVGYLAALGLPPSQIKQIQSCYTLGLKQRLKDVKQEKNRTIPEVALRSEIGQIMMRTPYLIGMHLYWKLESDPAFSAKSKIEFGEQFLRHFGASGLVAEDIKRANEGFNQSINMSWDEDGHVESFDTIALVKDPSGLSKKEALSLSHYYNAQCERVQVSLAKNLVESPKVWGRTLKRLTDLAQRFKSYVTHYDGHQAFAGASVDDLASLIEKSEEDSKNASVNSKGAPKLTKNQKRKLRFKEKKLQDKIEGLTKSMQAKRIQRFVGEFVPKQAAAKKIQTLFRGIKAKFKVDALKVLDRQACIKFAYTDSDNERLIKRITEESMSNLRRKAAGHDLANLARNSATTFNFLESRRLYRKGLIHEAKKRYLQLLEKKARRYEYLIKKYLATGGEYNE